MGVEILLHSKVPSLVKLSEIPSPFAEMLVNLDISWVILSHSESNELCLSETRLRMHFAQGLKVITCVGETLEQQEAIIGEAVFVGFNDEMTNLTNIRASESGPLLDGENPKDSQLPQFTHSRSKFLTTISVLNIKRLLSHTFWKRESLPIPDFVVMLEGNHGLGDDMPVLVVMKRGKNQLLKQLQLFSSQELSGHLIFQVHQEGMHHIGYEDAIYGHISFYLNNAYA
ncbi:hypothetical protein Bca101_058717 [Brassica carinata]